MHQKLSNTGYWERIDLPIHGDDRGSLIAIERNKGVEFEIKRIYYIFGTKPEVSRGFHAHHSLDQLLIAISGSCKILVNDGAKQEIIELSSPTKGLRIKDLIWREMYDFSIDCVLLVLASDIYKENDYLHDFETFLEATKKGL